MGKKIFVFLCLCVFPLCMSYNPVHAKGHGKPFMFGLLLVGPYNDQGWSQAHYDAGREIEKTIRGAKMIYIDKVNPADRPGITVAQLADDMAEKGVKLIIANSDDMKDGTREAAKKHQDIHFIHISGDDVLTGKASSNLTNLMGRMEYGKMMAGFAAAMTTRTGKIGYLGPLVNDETRRLAASCWLGAKYAWEKILGKNPKDLKFKVTWIGFWFNIPGVTADPVQVAGNFFDTGHDVVISGIDTTEALTVARRKNKRNRKVWAIPYDYEGACGVAPKVCLGVPYFNWYPGYKKLISESMAGKWKSQWLWLGPDPKDLNNPETSTIGFKTGSGLSRYAAASLDRFAEGLTSGRINLFKGPLYYKDGTTFLKRNEIADDMKIWYMKQLLKGMD